MCCVDRGSSPGPGVVPSTTTPSGGWPCCRRATRGRWATTTRARRSLCTGTARPGPRCQARTPRPSRLFGVHALSASNVWAVGEYFDGSIDKTLIVHWDGSAWTQVPSPNVSGATRKRPQGCARQFGHERLGGGLLRQQQQRGPDADPALERDVLEAGAKPGPERRGPGPGAHERGQQLSPRTRGRSVSTTPAWTSP